MSDLQSIGLLILGSVLGAIICAKSRSGGGVALFTLIAVVLFLSTPVGSGLPGFVSRVLSRVDESTTPALTNNGGSTAPAEVGRGGGGKR